MLQRLRKVFAIVSIMVILVITVSPQMASANSVTAKLTNLNDYDVTITTKSNSHGMTPKLTSTLVPAKKVLEIFQALSDGAGVEGDVDVAGGGNTWTLHYDNPVSGSNSCSVTPPNGKGASCYAGSGNNSDFDYEVRPTP